ncbi:MAG: glycosyltransferase [Gammaproteobacteria bacterium]|nr:glycosyltransferase [Gammaproteobacteria bacterium]
MAPVLIVTYDRLEHLDRTISSLRSNIYAEQTDLFIASDFQRSDSEADKVTAVRSYLKTIDGFKSVTVFAREKNFGLVENCNSAVQYILEKFDRIIIMNDDLVTALGFLKFINEGLDRYRDNVKVFSVTGYCPPIRIPSSYGYDAFFLGRMSAWGCAMTKESYESVCEITRNEFDDFIANKKLSRAFVKCGGQDLLTMLKRVAYDSLEAWDVQCMYTQFLKNQYTVYPSQSLVFNIGFDGTGMHCGKTDKFDVTLSDKSSFTFPDDVIIDRRIVKANYKFRAVPSYARKLLWKTRGLIMRLSGIYGNLLKLAAKMIKQKQ